MKDLAPKNRFERHPVRTWSVLAVVFLIAVELTVRALVGLGFLDYIPFRTTRRSVFWSDLDPHFGTWHFANTEFHHREACFDVTYRTNSIGARDRERERRSTAPRRAVVLGDSFAEGYGVASAARVSDRLEAATGIEHLNFGTAGTFGSVQEWMQYRTLVQQFDHTDVLVLALPDNDFADNDPLQFPPRRYRPFLVRDGDGFALSYRVAFEERDVDEYSTSKIVKNIVSNHIYTYNVIRNAYRVVKHFRRRHGEADRVAYNDYSPSDLAVLTESYRRIRQDMGEGRRLWIFSIPRLGEFLWQQSHGYDFRLPGALAAFAATQADTEYVDLFPGFLDYAREHELSWASFFHACDGHWSPLGHQVAAEIIAQHVYGASLE